MGPLVTEPRSIDTVTLLASTMAPADSGVLQVFSSYFVPRWSSGIRASPWYVQVTVPLFGVANDSVAF
ncbi:MAG: hypothetical protein DI536_31560 [Archangium gephyra]|uniref:Uncharacterized protein n=1 Tax=Archangium gephyra TaxID=48 RepID=A0A2W5SSP2_9BACT|nr:MAG: hypothetical protein DI536_31560 [Archangium gephyra]